MSSTYYCRIKGLDDDDWVDYEAKDHIEAASEYAKEVARQIAASNPAMYVKDLTVEVYSEKEDEFWRIEIDMITIRKG